MGRASSEALDPNLEYHYRLNISMAPLLCNQRVAGLILPTPTNLIAFLTAGSGSFCGPSRHASQVPADVELLLAGGGDLHAPVEKASVSRGVVRDWAG